ncbi:MAG: DsbA family oxidoreductase [Promethearchaeota archaeon]|jgi:predicted DsbA family dithiol-disulfide isomerase
MSQQKLKVIVFSDYICPFCYIGFHRIEKLKEQYDLDVEWEPFELHPETPKEGFKMDQISFPSEYLERVMQNVKRLADEDGLNLKYSGKLPNSRLALYVSEFARSKGKFDEFHKLIFDAYWKEGKDIGDISLLLDLADSIGLDQEEIKDYIKSDEPKNRLKKNMFELGRYGINGVPTFLIGDQFVIGAQPYEVFEKVIKQNLRTIEVKKD